MALAAARSLLERSPPRTVVPCGWRRGEGLPALVLGMAKRPPPSGGAQVSSGQPGKRAALSWASEILPESEASSLHDALRSVFGHGASGGGQERAEASPVVDLTAMDSGDEDEVEEQSGAAAVSTSASEPSSDDDGLEVLDNPAPVASPEIATITLGDGDDECVIVGRSSSAIETLPHARADCVIHPFAVVARTFCDSCYCYVCDFPAADCGSWTVHCQATHADPFWREERKQHRKQRQSVEQDAARRERGSASPAPRVSGRAVKQQARTAAPGDAIEYVSIVKRALAVSEPQKWKQFLEVLKRYREEGRTSGFVLESLTPLLHGKPELLAGLHRFIDPGSARPSSNPTAPPSPLRTSASGEV